MTTVEQVAASVGTSTTRVEALDKVTGAARYAGEYPLDELAHGVVVTSTIGRGRVVDVDADAVLALPGVLGVLHHGNAPRLAEAGDATLLLLQDDARRPPRCGRRAGRRVVAGGGACRGRDPAGHLCRGAPRHQLRRRPPRDVRPRPRQPGLRHRDRHR
ncbi:MAG: hypothetical protein WKF76_07770 [Nocardioidaceae bacterium]